MKSFFQGVKISGEHYSNRLAFQNGRQTGNERNLPCSSKYGHLPISQDICHVRMTDIEGFLTIYGHSDNLLNNKRRCLYIKFDNGVNLWGNFFFPRELFLRIVKKPRKSQKFESGKN